MLYVFYGTDISKGVEKAHNLVNSLRTKRPDASFVHIDGDAWNPAAIEEHLGGQGLFSNKYIVFLDRVTEKSEAKEELPDLIPAMKESANIFIILEGKTNAEIKKAFEKYAEKAVELEIVKDLKGEKKEFNIFALGDAFGSRDAFKAWMIYRQAVESGLEAESIVGTLFWQAKSMAVARNTSTAGEAGLNPFVYGKSKRYVSNYSEGELSNVLEKLITIYHDGHRGLVDIELSIEKLLLMCGK
jgi:DNA polymerase III delta subunit